MARGAADIRTDRRANHAGRNWSAATVRTLVGRPIGKGAATAGRIGRRCLYRPPVIRKDYVTTERESLIGRLFEGRLAPLMLHLAEKPSGEGVELSANPGQTGETRWRLHS